MDNELDHLTNEELKEMVKILQNNLSQHNCHNEEEPAKNPDETKEDAKEEPQVDVMAQITTAVESIVSAFSNGKKSKKSKSRMQPIPNKGNQKNDLQSMFTNLIGQITTAVQQAQNTSAKSADETPTDETPTNPK